MNTITEPSKKDSLGKTFVRGFVGGVGWVFGVTIGWTILILVLFRVFSALGLSDELQNYINDFIDKTTQQQINRQQEVLQNLDLAPAGLYQNQAIDEYPNNLQELLYQNKAK